MIKKFFKSVVKVLPSFTIRLPNPKTGIKEDYLTRYYLFLKDRKYFNIFIHEFHSSDLDIGLEGYGLLHNHPFKFSLSFILTNGYWEERLNSDGNISKTFRKPLSFNFIRSSDLHRVDLLEGEQKVWTIFITGSRRNTWEFYDRVSKEYSDWTNSPNAIK